MKKDFIREDALQEEVISINSQTEKKETKSETSNHYFG